MPDRHPENDSTRHRVPHWPITSAPCTPRQSDSMRTGDALAHARSANSVDAYARADPYHWLRAVDWQSVLEDPSALEPSIRQYLELENSYSDGQLADTRELQQRLVAEMRARMRPDQADLPEKDGPYAYYWRYREGGEYPLLVRTPREGGDEQVLIDGNIEADGRAYFEFGCTEVSPDHRWLAWSADFTGSERYRLFFRDLHSGADLGYSIDSVDSVAWVTANELLYTVLDEQLRSLQAFRHQLRTWSGHAAVANKAATNAATELEVTAASASPPADVCVLQESDVRFHLAVMRLRSGCYIALSISTDTQDEVWLLDTRVADARPVLVTAREPGLEYSVDHQGDRLLILTNRGDAIDYCIMQAPVGNWGIGQWRELVPHEPGCLRLSLDAFADFFVCLERRDALPRLVLYLRSDEAGSADPNVAATASHVADGAALPVVATVGPAPIVVPLPTTVAPAYALTVAASPEFNARTVRFGIESPADVCSWYDYRVDTATLHSLRRDDLPAGHDASAYICERICVSVSDGADVPVTLLYRRDQRTPMPCLVTAYGAYGDAQPADFCSDRLSLVDRGCLFALVHVRGGDERGRGWYEAARRQRKQRSFDDFTEVVTALGRRDDIDALRVAAYGISAGGLLMGAALNQAPELFAGIVAEVPFVDAVATLLDASIPLTPGEWEQWGNPLDSADERAAIAAYSPIDNVDAKAYPPVLATTAVADPRVGYWEAAKWIARLREASPAHGPYLLHTEIDSGHGGSPGRYAALHETARVTAFILKVTGTDGSYHADTG